MTTQKIVEELDRVVRVRGFPTSGCRRFARIDMLATGIKSPVGIKVAGPDLAGIDRVAQAIEHAVKNVPGVTSALRAAQRTLPS
jgi:Cu(I)/Ag(I) efflux system membrane protein CusA/SilA